MELDFYNRHADDFQVAKDLLEKISKTEEKADEYYHSILQISFIETILLEKYASYACVSELILIADYRFFKEPTLYSNKMNKVIVTVFPSQLYSTSIIDYDKFKLENGKGRIAESSIEKIDGALLITFKIESPDTLTLTGIINLTDTLSNLNQSAVIEEELIVIDN
jgi:hypothetical protein